LAIEAVVVADSKPLAAEWLKDLEALCKRFWTMEALSGRKVRLDPDEPAQRFGTGYRPFAHDVLVRKVVEQCRGVLTGDNAANGIYDKEAKAVAVGEYVQELQKNPDAKL
jgi:hypothetical protein